MRRTGEHDDVTHVTGVDVTQVVDVSELFDVSEMFSVLVSSLD